MSDLQANLARVRAEKSQVEAELRASRNDLAALRTFAERASAAVGHCPNSDCKHEITGYDLLGIGRCRNCQQPLTSLITPSTKSGLDQPELMLLFGALGAVLALAVLSSGG